MIVNNDWKKTDDIEIDLADFTLCAGICRACRGIRVCKK